MNKQVKRTFILGEEWLYYKIYCGNYSADNILSETILPIVKKLHKKKLIKKWFFIRYNDPKNHLRLRFQINDTKNIQKIIFLIQAHFRELIEKDLVNDIVTATYKREIERYGETTIELIEKLFYYQSKKVLKLICNTTKQNDEIARIFASILMIDEMLEQFKMSFNDRISFVKSMEQAYKAEHEIEKENNKKLDQLYRAYKNEIELYLQEKQEPLYLQGLIKLFKTTKKEIAIINDIIEGKPSIPIESLISPIIHMNINRIFRSKQRQYEMLCYDFMTRYYKSIAARK
ncbi:thiopeptide-type bacteriocin biosynthesis protein [Flavobacterium sp. LHD-85]|uniref:thiopeptide-type bacteriocin biosynthesis protein n=1 Tax=Flavobacterium sp. LHD-85 TaxID=3071410 RepID=UPI0027DEBDED|nr:thiopeptide-type bacteriocin biosynthesis protein [Flavobacterium sp. LHD-85]MDQ6531238.1 thiopeptide-type bacteriocin biosynthesis protein [Flavobacterium sp. LHD-85]